MTTYQLRHKPTTVHAVPFNGHNVAEVQAFAGGYFRPIEPYHLPGDGTVVAELYSVIHSEWSAVRAGQWIVRGAVGELYAIFPQVAHTAYETPEGGWPDAPQS